MIKMNKLLVSDIIDIDEGSYELNCKSKEITINIHKTVNLYLINEEVEKININLNNNSILNIYKYDEEIKNDLKVIINQNNNSKINYYASFVNRKNSNLVILNNIKGNDNYSNINIRNVSEDGNSTIIIESFLESKTINNEAIENLKGITNGGLVHIEPNIEVSSNEVVANHFTTIGGLSNDAIFYLMGKGIKKEMAKKILLKGFKFSNMDEYIKNKCGVI